jgi:hypothetical protein
MQTKSLTLDASQLHSTKRSTTLVLTVVVILVIGSAIGVFLYSMPPSTSSSSSSSAPSSASQSASGGANFKVLSDSIVVGYNSGLWTISLQDVGGKSVRTLTVVLGTPTESKMCTGFSSGLSFSNCPATPRTPDFAVNATFSGFAAGAGAGSAKPGNSYAVKIMAVFADGTTVTETSTVQATSG